MTRTVAFVLALTVVLARPDAASAHARSESYSDWRLHDGRVTATITISSTEAAQLVEPGNTRPLDALFLDHARETIAVDSPGGACALAAANALDAARGFLRVELGWDCPGDAVSAVRYRAMMDAAPAHVHFARFHAGGRGIAEVLFTDRADTWTAAGDTTRYGFGAFLDLGIRHIAGGVDHIAFLLGMLLVAGSIRRSVVAVTGFTLGHSVSLAAAVLGYLHADGRLVEAFIGYTVALVAAEYFALARSRAEGLAITVAAAAAAAGVAAWSAGLVTAKALAAYLGFALFAYCYLAASARPAARGGGNVLLFVATACFGLVHGFGFAGFLMETGLGGGSLFLPLLGFNLGVEVGQLALLSIAFLLSTVLVDARLRVAAPLVAAALCGVGTYWFIGRSLAA